MSLKDEDTKDIQHDLAMLIADGEEDCTLAQQFKAELSQREEVYPINCRWEYSMYTRGKRVLLYDIPGESEGEKE